MLHTRNIYIFFFSDKLFGAVGSPRSYPQRYIYAPIGSCFTFVHYTIAGASP